MIILLDQTQSKRQKSAPALLQRAKEVGYAGGPKSQIKFTKPYTVKHTANIQPFKIKINCSHQPKGDIMRVL